MEATDSPTYTPLPEARITEPVEIDMASLGHYIPEWAGRERIGVNMEVLAEVAQIMRMRSLTVLGMRESGEEEIVVQGVFEDGSATGAASGRVTFQNRVSDSGERPSFWENPYKTDCGRATDFRGFVIRLNLAGLEHRIANGNGRLRDPSQWADFINQELIKEIKKMTWKRFGMDASKMSAEMFYPVLMLGGLIAMPLIEASKGKLDWRALLAATGTITIIGLVPYLIDDPRVGAIILYMIGMGTAKHDEWLEKTKKSQEKEKPSEPYDPVTPLTFANFEWDRLLGVHHLLSRYKLITLLEEIESPTKNQ